MKKLFLALFIGAMFVSSAYAAIPPDPGVIGIIKREKGAVQGQPTIVYKLVRNSSLAPATGTISVGSAVVYDTNSDDGVSVRMTTTSHDNAFAGIAATLITPDTSAIGGTVANDDAGKGNWGWITIHGPANALASTGGTNGNAAGVSFITSRDAGAITGIENYGVNVPTSDIIGAAVGSGGFFFDAAGTASASTDPGAGAGNTGTVAVFVREE